MADKRTNRLLVIEKLVVAIPDDYGADPNKITIDEALQFLLEQRQTAKAVLFNTNGNYIYFNAAFPDGINPEDPEDFTSNMLVATLQQNDDLDYAGLMFTLVYDEDLGGYRNIYTPKEEQEFLVRKALYLAEKKKSEEATTSEDEEFYPQETTEDTEGDIEKGGKIVAPQGEDTEDDVTEAFLPCEGCDEICSERCPNESYEEE